MIICIAGVSSTGKTTLLKNLRDNIKIIESQGIKVIFKQEFIRDYVTETYTESMTEILDDPEKAIKLQFDLARYTYDMYVEMISDPETLYICDRSPLDTLVYTTLNYSCAPEDLLEKYAEAYSESCNKLRLLSNYVDRIYLTLPDISTMVAEDDGFRPTKYNCRRNLELELFNSIFEFNPKVVKLPSLPNMRVVTVLNDLSDKLGIHKRF